MENLNIDELNKNFMNRKKQDVLDLLPEGVQSQASMAFDYENEGEYDKAVQVCREILEKETGADVNELRIFLARVYPKLLKMDVEEENQRYAKDEQAYREFLEQVPMNEIMQQYLVETLANLCELMEYEWYRPLYRQLVEYVEKQGYITSRQFEDTFVSAYIVMESFACYEDNGISMVLKAAIKNRYNRLYTLKEENDEDRCAKIIVDDLTYQWYTMLYNKEHSEELDYIREKYPYSYHMLEEVLQEFAQNEEDKQEELMRDLMAYTMPGITKEQMKEAMEKSYRSILKQQAVHLYGKKVGRNDPCPCGSGKKYKQCCGK